MPFVTGPRTSFPQARCDSLAELLAPAPHRFIADQNATRGHQFFHIAKAHSDRKYSHTKCKMISFGNRWPRYGLPNTHSGSHPPNVTVPAGL
jgi:hypothetical protein